MIFWKNVLHLCGLGNIYDMIIAEKWGDILSPIFFYRIALDQISHTWFDWNLVNGFSLVRKTVWINSRLQNFFIACVHHTLLPKKIVKALIEAS